jgi:hypothetical protein
MNSDAKNSPCQTIFFKIVSSLCFFYATVAVFISRMMIISQIHSHLLGDKVDIELSYRAASLCSLTGRYDNPLA